MGFFQPKIPSLPKDINLAGKTAVITGASAGLGLETARQLLQLNISTLILAVRNVSKGEKCAKQLLHDPGAKEARTQTPTIKAMELDMDRYDSVQAFAKAVKEEIPHLDILILNAGINLMKLERSDSGSGHERTTQVNYLSNALLLMELLPYLQSQPASELEKEAGAGPVRITWVGSRAYAEFSTFEKKAPIKSDESVLGHMDAEEYFFGLQRYVDNKVLCAMFFYTLAERLAISKKGDGKRDVLFNMVCPGMVDTGLSDGLPAYMRVPVNVVKSLRARSVEVGARIIVNAAAVVGMETHGKFLNDLSAAEPSRYLKSTAGKEVQKKLWVETTAEMAKLTTLPLEFLVEG